jgi:hypothetical protein
MLEFGPEYNHTFPETDLKSFIDTFKEQYVDEFDTKSKIWFGFMAVGDFFGLY